MKLITSICLLLITVAWLPLRAADGEPVVVTSSSVENKLVSLRAERAGKATAFTCFVDRPPCSAAQPGEYVMVRAGAGEGIYNDCTNVVLYRSSPSSGAREKIGVYCWGNDECYMVNCGPVEVQTVPASVPDKTVSPTGTVVGANRPLEKEGRLIVIVTWGDIDNTPARNVVVGVHGYTRGLKSPPEMPILLKPTKDGQYEASIQPGIYDVFVSEATSVPRCRRLQVNTGLSSYWTLKLEIDDVYLDK
jgi:hypothetical protein